MRENRKKTKAATAKQAAAQFEEWHRQEDMKRARAIAQRAGCPTRTFEQGASVRYGGWTQTTILDVYEDGLFYEVSSISADKGSKEEKRTQKAFVPWVNLLPLEVGTTNFTCNEDIRLNYHNSTIESLLSKHLLFGVDFAPDYQRELVWSEQDREALLDSVFMGADIGRFVFRVKNEDEVDSPDGDFYEIVDGKQRMTALLDYYAGRYSYRGAYYHELSARDRRRFKDASVSVAEARNLSKKDTLRLFLMLNRGGRPVSDEIIQRAYNSLNEMD